MSYWEFSPWSVWGVLGWCLSENAFAYASHWLRYYWTMVLLIYSSMCFWIILPLLPRILGIDKHFFSCRRSYVITFVDLAHYRFSLSSSSACKLVYNATCNGSLNGTKSNFLSWIDRILSALLSKNISQTLSWSLSVLMSSAGSISIFSPFGKNKILSDVKIED